jgi:protocatechuate 3,4-dioxygenase beta subunit
MEWLGAMKKDAIVCVMMLLLTATASAQSGTTSVRGVITDQKGASVPDATVTLTSADIGVTLKTQTDKDGAYQFLEVRPATYSLTAEAPGFASHRQTNL